MENSIDTAQNSQSLLNSAKSTIGFFALTSAPKAAKTVIKNKGIKNAVNSLEIENFKKLNLSLRNNDLDIFTRGVEVSKNYETYSSLVKRTQKLEKIASKAAKKGKVSFVQSIKNLFTKNKTTVEKLQQSSKEAIKELNKAKNSIASGKSLIQQAGESAVKTSAKGTVKSLFRSEMKNKFVLGFTIFGAVPRIKEEVIPAFKEKGIVEGVKVAGKVLARTAVDFVSNAGFSAIGRAIGTAAGSIIPGIGNLIGGTLGDMLGTTISMHLTSKIFDKNKETDNTATKQVKSNRKEFVA